MNKVFLVLPAVMMLAACGTPSVEDFIEDKGLAEEVAQECQKMTPNDIAESQKCTNLMLAMKQVQTENLKKIMGSLDK